MKKSKKKMGLAIAACALSLTLAFGGTMAYLTDAETAENTFTIGEVKIALEEPNFPGNNTEATTDLVPNEVVPKDPQVKNTGLNDAIIFMKVEVPKANITIVLSDGTKITKSIQEIFNLRNLSVGDNGSWMEIRKDDTADDKCVYVFTYKTKLTKDATTSPLFTEVQLKNFIENEIDRTTQNIIINAYAIQSTEIQDIDMNDLTSDTLNKVYDIYINQSGDKPSRKMTNARKITFNANGGSVTPAETEIGVGEKYGSLPELERKGHHFDGWYTAANNGDKVDSNTVMSNKDVALYAHWTPYTMKINYHSDGATYIAWNEGNSYTNGRDIIMSSTEIYGRKFSNGSNGLFDGDRWHKPGYTAKSGWKIGKTGTVKYDDRRGFNKAEDCAKYLGVLSAFEKGNITVDLYPIWK